MSVGLTIEKSLGPDSILELAMWHCVLRKDTGTLRVFLSRAKLLTGCGGPSRQKT